MRPRLRTETSREPAATTERNAAGLRAQLAQIDGADWIAYRALGGEWNLDELRLLVDRVPSGPFAGSTWLRVALPRESCGVVAAGIDGRVRRVAVEDWLARRAVAACTEATLGRSGRPGGHVLRLQTLGAAVVERSAVRVGSQLIELRLLVELPAAGRRIRSRQAEDLLLTVLPRLAKGCLMLSSAAAADARAAADLAEDHAVAQRALSEHGWVAFIADGSRLAREAGQRAGSVPRDVSFLAPPDLAVELDLPHAGRLRGLGIPAGVTLIVGGSAHGKSTLLRAIAGGVYPHPTGDGRERVVALEETVTIRAEEGRSVRAVDLSAFLGALPTGENAACFGTDRASGSVAQAAAVAEALEAGARLMLIDEDASAPPFLVRDGRMQRLVPAEGEPLVPFVDRVRELYRAHGVSTILAGGSCGDFFDAADTVIRMERYQPADVGGAAKQIAAATRDARLREPRASFARPTPRRVLPDPELTRRRYGVRGPRALRVADETIDLAAVEVLAEPGQVRAIARLLERRFLDAVATPFAGLLDEFERLLDEEGLDALERPVAYELSRPRRFEIAAVLDRWRALRLLPLDAP